LTASTLGSKASGGDYDTVLAVFTYSGSFTHVACNDDSNVDPNHHHLSRVTFDATSGTTYYFQVGSFGGFQYKHSRLRFNLSFGPALDATVGSESGSNACFVHVTGSGLYPATHVYYDYSGSPDNVLGTVAGDGTFDNTSAFVEQAYTFHSLDFNGDPISTGSVNVSCLHT
jgi:hypothetical protein